MSHKVERPDLGGKSPIERLNDAPREAIVSALARFCSPPDANGCVRWTGWLSRAGYGQMYVSRWLRTAAHRAAWVAENGPMDPAVDACHRCDNRWCVNPGHIFPGTRSENMIDAGGKGKLRGRPPGTRPQTQYERGWLDALEAAAKVCDEAVYNERPASPQHAAAIRALKEKQ